jgi:hypothetical protein
MDGLFSQDYHLKRGIPLDNMQPIVKRSKHSGTFTISPGNQVYGELTLDGAKTSLYLHDKQPFDTRGIRHLSGVLHDLTKVSLVNCITPGVGSGGSREERYHFANIFPHFVVYGDYHINPDENEIAAVHFVVDDATTLFYDFDAFGSVIDARPYIDEIANANRPYIDKIANTNRLDRETTTGPNPEILYFTGKHEIFITETVLGRISASHHPSHTLGDPEGVRLKNTIVVTIAFADNVTFDDAITRTLTLSRYLGLLVGRPQNIRKLSLQLGTDHERPAILRVYCSRPARREPSHGSERTPHPAEVLLDAVRQPEQFSAVLRSWLDRQEAWHDARLRFFDSFAEQWTYGIDRLIRAANMFDILPDSAAPKHVELTDELNKAQSECLRLFCALPDSPERSSILEALKRIGESTLKRKVRYRAERLIEVLGERFPELLVVTDQAVNCRNYYVHGGKPRFDYDKNFNVVAFLTDTLQFVFAASDLIECGWGIKAWSEIPSSMAHPFGCYRVTYEGNLQSLKALLWKRS